MMLKTTWLFILAALLCLQSGCSQSTTENSSGAASHSPLLSQHKSSMPAQASLTEEDNPGRLTDVKKSPIEYAQKEYLDAYNDYVRLLRESGPQTIETLQALALYQKKYQIYQMILKAGKN